MASKAPYIKRIEGITKGETHDVAG